MTSARLRYILGGALCGALLGAVYANYMYTRSLDSVFGTDKTVSEPEWVEPTRAESAQVQQRASETKEE